MGRVVVSTNPLDATDVQDHSHTGPFIDWLLVHFPGGFSGPHVAALNLKRLAVEDYDTEIGPHDVLSLAVMPGVPAAIFPAAWGAWATVAAAAANALISIGLNYAINALFGPKAAAPKAPAAMASTPAAGSVYSLSVPTNLARIGQPIQVCYGKNLVVPAQAMAPYSYYLNNDQYVCQLMAIGQGTYEIHQVKIAESNVDEIGAGVVEYSIWPSSAHGMTFGTIAAATGIAENVYTSPEVTDLELYAIRGGVFTTSAELWNGCWPKKNYAGVRCDVYQGGLFRLGAPAGEYAEALYGEGGRPVYMTVTNGGVNNGTYPVGFIWSSANREHDDKPDSRLYVMGHMQPGFYWAANGGATVTLSYVIGEEAGGPMGPYAASPPCMLTEHLQFDLVFPAGCYLVAESGALNMFRVEVAFRIELVDNTGAALGPVYSHVWAEYMASNTPQRRSIDFYPPKGRYRVSAHRTTALSDRAQDQSICYWTGLKSFLGPYCDADTPVYGDVTLLAMRIRATEGLSSSAHQHISVSCTRQIDGVSTRSPLAAFRDIYTNTIYGGRRPLTELDTTALAAVAAEVPECKFDAVFDQTSTIWEALGLSVQMIRGIPIISGGLISLVRDKPHCVPVAAFNEDLITSLSRSFLFAEIGDYDGIEGEYIDPLDASKQYVVWPQTAENPEPMVLWGCTSMARAQCFIRQFWQQRQLRRRLTTFATELDANVIDVGDPINISHRTLGPDPVMHIVSAIRPNGQYSAEVDAYIYEPGVFA